jgi:hypothetical protein
MFFVISDFIMVLTSVRPDKPYELLHPKCNLLLPGPLEGLRP